MTTSFRTETDGLSGAVAFANIDNIKLVNTGPELLGVPKAPTAAVGISTTQVATTAFVSEAIAAAAAAGGLQPSNAIPIMNALIPAAGTATAYSRGDHVHETDNKLVKKVGDTMTGPLLGTSFQAGSGGSATVINPGAIEVTGAIPTIDLKNSFNEDYDVRIELNNGALGMFVGSQYAELTNQAVWQAAGYKTRNGLTGGYGGNTFNISWGGGAFIWIDSTNVGQITLTSDARIKKDVQAAPSMTEQVKLMRPVTYKFADVDIWKDDGIRRYGFIAQELRAVPALHDTVVGETDALTKDGGVQPLTLDPLQLVAVLTKALQESIARIEQLEAYVATHP